MRQTPFVQRPHIVPILVRQRLNYRRTESHQGHHGYVKILDNTPSKRQCCAVCITHSKYAMLSMLCCVQHPLNICHVINAVLCAAPTQHMPCYQCCVVCSNSTYAMLSMLCCGQHPLAPPPKCPWQHNTMQNILCNASHPLNIYAMQPMKTALHYNANTWSVQSTINDLICNNVNSYFFK